VAALKDASVSWLGACARPHKRAKRVYLLEAGEGYDAQPLQAGHHPKSRVSDRNAWVAGIVLVPTLVLRTCVAPHSVVASLAAAAAGTESSFAAAGRMGSTVQSKDLLGHRRQICVATRRR
jgi:hypothetical protein